MSSLFEQFKTKHCVLKPLKNQLICNIAKEIDKDFVPINSHLAKFKESWKCPGNKSNCASVYSGMCRVFPNKNNEKTSQLTEYAHGVVRIVKHDGTVKEGCMRNGAWHGLYREVKGEEVKLDGTVKGEVTIFINYPGKQSSHVTFKRNDGKLKQVSESDPQNLLEKFKLVENLLNQ